jgi:hypothetical protein
VQLDYAFGILVRGGQDFRTNRDAGVELFANFPDQAVCQRFVSLALAAWELPVPFQMGALDPSCQQERAVTLDDSRGDEDVRFSTGTDVTFLHDQSVSSPGGWVTREICPDRICLSTGTLTPSGTRGTAAFELRTPWRQSP